MKAKWIRFLQLNLNHCETAQNLVLRTAEKLSIDVAILCDQHRPLMPQHTWISDADNQAAIWVCKRVPVQRCSSGQSHFYIWAQIAGIFIFSIQCWILFYSAQHVLTKSEASWIVFCSQPLDPTRLHSFPPSQVDVQNHSCTLVEKIEPHSSTRNSQACCPTLLMRLEEKPRYFNAWSTEWGSRETKPRGEALLHALALLNVLLLNTGSKPTFVGQRGGFIVDLTFAGVSLHDRIRSWRVSDTYTGSDHQAIIFEVLFEENRSVNHLLAGNRKWSARTFDGDCFAQVVSAMTVRSGIPEDMVDERMSTIVRECDASMSRGGDCQRREPVYWWNDSIEECRWSCLQLQSGLAVVLTRPSVARMLEFTTDNGAETYDVTAGVPQGSVLGPILWNVMYDRILRLKLPGLAKIVGFADDIAVTVVAKHLDLVEFCSNETIRLVRAALTNLGLQTADQKTEVFLVTIGKVRETITLPATMYSGQQRQQPGQSKTEGRCDCSRAYMDKKCRFSLASIIGSRSAACSLLSSAHRASRVVIQEAVQQSSTKKQKLGESANTDTSNARISRKGLLSKCTTKDEIAEALSTSLSAPHLNKDVVKTLQKAYAGKQAAVVALPGDLTAKALKLGNIRIVWVNCRIRGREDTLRCYRFWSPSHVSARCKGPDRSAHCFRCGQTGDRIKDCKNNPTYVFCQELGAVHDHASTSHKAAQDLLSQTILEQCINVAVVCDQFKNLDPPYTWLADANSQVAIWVQGGGLVQECPARARPFFTWARINRIYFFSVYAPPRLADVEFSALLANIIEETWGKRPLIVAGDFNAWSTEWGCRVTRQRATILLDALATLEAALLNTGDTPTFTGALGYSVIDLTFASDTLVEKNFITKLLRPQGSGLVKNCIQNHAVNDLESTNISEYDLNEIRGFFTRSSVIVNERISVTFSQLRRSQWSQACRGTSRSNSLEYIWDTLIGIVQEMQEVQEQQSRQIGQLQAVLQQAETERGAKTPSQLPPPSPQVQLTQPSQVLQLPQPAQVVHLPQHKLHIMGSHWRSFGQPRAYTMKRRLNKPRQALHLYKWLWGPPARTSTIVTLNDTESLLLELGRGNRKLLVGSVYRRPGGFYWNEFFDTYYSLCHRPYNGVIIAGDFNVDLLSDDYETVHFRRLVMEASLEFVPFGATHHGATFDTAIDSIIVDSLDRIITSVKSPTPYTAAHDSLMIEYKLVDPLPVGDTGFYRDRRSIAVPEFEPRLRLALDGVRDLRDVDRMANGAHNIMLDALNTFAPLRRRTVRAARAPWFTPALKEMQDARRTLPALQEDEGPGLAATLQAAASRDQERIEGSPCCSTEAGRWSYLRRIGISAPQLPSPLTFFAPEELLDHYCAVTTVHPGFSADGLGGIIAMDMQSDLPAFSFRDVTEAEVLSALARVAGGVGTGSGDGLSLAYFGDALAALAPVLVSIINCMISTGKYPQLWKKSYIRPLSKVRIPSSPAQTRPVSNLPHLAKVCDRLLTAQITEHLESHSLLSPMQSGFREGFSTHTALIKVTEDIRRGVEDGLVTILLLFDFKSAFDMLNHANLILALRKLNFSPNALSLLHSYLSQRSQAVMDDVGNLTEFRAYTSGVPQGSTPAPILFAVYIDSLTRIFRYCAATHMMFADDLQIYVQCPPSETNATIAKLNEEAHSVASWAHENGLVLNVSKTKAVLFASDQNLMRIPWDLCSKIVLEGTEIPFEDCVKNLGLMYRSLSWKNQVSVISSRVYGVLHRLRSAAGFLPPDIKKILVNTLDWLTPSDRRAYLLNLFTYKMLSTARPEYLRELYHLPNDRIRRSARLTGGALTLEVPFADTTTYKMGFAIQAANEWNALPAQLRSAGSLPLYKRLLRDHMRRSSTKRQQEWQEPSRRSCPTSVGPEVADESSMLMSSIRSSCIERLSGCATETQAYIRQAEAVHRRACLRVISGRPHVSYDVTYVIGGVPPLALLADERARIYQRHPENVKEEDRSETLRKWQDRWDRALKGRWTHRLIPNITEWVGRGLGEVNYYLTQLLSGHGYFKSLSQRYDNDLSALCPACPTTIEDAEHVFFRCPQFYEERERLQQVLQEGIKPENIVRLMLETASNWMA
ncbi:unnamed protein product, partial [Trichogramma brassicae]